jgi:hypothetical protein
MEDSLGIPEKVQVVVQTGRPGLVSEWQAQFGSPPLPKLRVELMRPVLIYRIQENAFGLSGPRRKGRIQVSLPMRIVATQDRDKNHPRVERQLHEVAVTAEGYIYNGEYPHFQMKGTHECTHTQCWLVLDFIGPRETTGKRKPQRLLGF